MDDQDNRWPRELAMALGALLAVALVIGGVVGVVALGAANVVGLGSSGSGASSQPTLYIPSSSPTPTPSREPTTPTESATAAPATDEAAKAPKEKTPKEKKRRMPRPRITLSADPTSAPANSRIYLTGTYRRGGGATLQVQRFDGGWGDFPVTVTVQGGTFETWIQSGREGVNRFRVVDPATGLASKPVSVTLT